MVRSHGVNLRVQKKSSINLLLLLCFLLFAETETLGLFPLYEIEIEIVCPWAWGNREWVDWAFFFDILGFRLDIFLL